MHLYLLPPSNALAQFEMLCTYELMELYVKDIFPYKPKEMYGDANLLNLFVSHGLQVDLAVLLYEYIELLEMIDSEGVQIIKSDDNYSDLRELRNKLHTHNNKGKYYKIARDIIDEQSIIFGLHRLDKNHSLRNDISLYFEIKNEELLLTGSNYYWFHTIKNINPDKTKGKKLMIFAAYMANMAKGFTSTINNKASFELSPLRVKREHPRIEGFDFKSYELFRRIDLDKTVIFRLLSALTHISYGIFILDSVLEWSTINQNNLWYCYFIKNLAIKFDESLDNIRSMLSYGSSDNRDKLKKALESNQFHIDQVETFAFARNLRNTIHYQVILFDQSFNVENSAQYIEAIYLSNTSQRSMHEFRVQGDKLYKECKQLQRSIQSIFNLNENLNI